MQLNYVHTCIYRDENVDAVTATKLNWLRRRRGEGKGGKEGEKGEERNTPHTFKTKMPPLCPTHSDYVGRRG